jgi:DNA-directed RNA polymerase-3 subunit RPC5
MKPVTIKQDPELLSGSQDEEGACETPTPLPVDVPSSSTNVLDDPTLLSALLNDHDQNDDDDDGMNDDINDDMSEDPDDEIVREIDVFLSPQLANHLHLIQFPLQPASHTQPPRTVYNKKSGKTETKAPQPPVPSSAQIKPMHSILELEYPLPSGSTSNQRQIPQVLNLQSRTYTSHSIPMVTHMALGVLSSFKVKQEDGSDDRKTYLDLIPLSKVLQMRPSFAHVDAIFANDDEDLNAPSNTTNAKDKDDGAKPVLFRKPESERAALLKRTSYAAKKEREEAEEWIQLNVDAYGPEQKLVWKQSACPRQDRETNLQFVSEEGGEGGTKAYVKSLNYLQSSTKTMNKDSAMEDFNPATVVDEVDVDADETSQQVESQWKLELTARVATLFQGRGGVSIPYPVIRPRFQTCIADQDLLDAISACAVLVRGNFMLKSSLMGFSNLMIAEARDVILILFMNYGILQRETLSHMFHKVHNDSKVISEQVLNGILDLVGKKTVNGVEMKIEDDLSFGGLYPHVARSHDEYWEQKTNYLRNYIRVYEAQLD